MDFLDQFPVLAQQWVALGLRSMLWHPLISGFLTLDVEVGGQVLVLPLAGQSVAEQGELVRHAESLVTCQLLLSLGAVLT